jgi:hypothetical protein
MKKVALPKRSSKSTTKGKKKMAKRKATRRKAPAKTRARRRKATRSTAKKSRVTLYKRGNKYYAPRKSGRYAPTLRKGMKVNPARRRKVRRNPKFSLKKVLNTKLVINGSLIAGGFIAGAFVAQKIREFVPQLSMLGKFSGAVNIVAGLLGASLVKGEKAKMVSLGMVASGAYDIINQNVMPLIAPTATPAMGYHGLPKMGFHDKMQSYQDLGSGATYMGSDASLLGADASLLGSDTSLLGDMYEHEMDDIEEAF